MPPPQLPTGRVLSTAQRDLHRAIFRALDDGPARPTTEVAPMLLAAPTSSQLAGSAGPETGSTSAAALAEVLPLVGGWSLTTDATGALVARHEDGSHQVIAERTAPAPTTGDGNG